jgi:3'(2'), 5'-bisphosphate nucleotidase
MPPSFLVSPEAKFAIDAVREASLLARQIQSKMVGSGLTKDDRSPVTVADFAVQAVIARRLAESIPGAALVGEEAAESLRLAEGVETLDQITTFVREVVSGATPEEVCGLIDRGSGEPGDTFWTLDPIDGTKGFLRREQYAIALAFIDSGKVELGVLGCPELNGGTVAVAARGKGTYSQPLSGGSDWRPLKVSPRHDAKEARILRSVEKAHTNVDEIGQLAAKLGVTAPPVPMDSQAKYAVLAAGEGDVLLRLISPSRRDYKEKIWDQAAGSIVIEEAGGRISDLDGKPLDFSHGRTLAKNRGILATNGQLHEAFSQGLKAIGA